MSFRYPADARAARAELDAMLLKLAKRWPEMLTFFLVVVLAMQLAYWTWIFVTPKAPLPPAATATNDTRAALATVVDAHLFGQAGNDAGPPAVASAANMRLTGVFAAIGTLPAFAIISVDGQPSQPVKNGGSIGPGIVLEAVFPDHVLIRRNGIRERLDLEARGTATGQPGGVAAAQFPVNIENVGQREFRFSRNQLSGALQDPKMLGNMGRAVPYPAGGVMLEEIPPGSLPERLGLRPGDVVRQINGQFIGSPQEMPRIYQQFVSGGLTEARLEIVRGGQPQQFIYHIQP